MDSRVRLDVRTSAAPAQIASMASLLAHGPAPGAAATATRLPPSPKDTCATGAWTPRWPWYGPAPAASRLDGSCPAEIFPSAFTHRQHPRRPHTRRGRDHRRRDGRVVRDHVPAGQGEPLRRRPATAELMRPRERPTLRQPRRENLVTLLGGVQTGSVLGCRASPIREDLCHPVMADPVHILPYKRSRARPPHPAIRSLTWYFTRSPDRI